MIDTSYAYESLRDRPETVRKEIKRIREGYKWKADSQVEFLSPGLSISRILADQWFPNFGQAFDMNLKARYQTRGVSILARLVKAFRKSGEVPSSPAQLESMTGSPIPRDLYSEDKAAPCRFIAEGRTITLYSLGIGSKDDSGDPGKDFILFRVTLD